MREYDKEIRMGESNRDAIQLVSNYCAHARVETFAQGMLAEIYGLPIGSYAMKCDHASDAGITSHDLRHSVVDFYDRNCSACPHRQAVRLPNITQIIGERDRAKAEREAAEEQARKVAEDELSARSGVRGRLAPELGPVSRAILEDLQLYDEDRSDTNFRRLTESARLAPQHFPPTLVEYLFELADTQSWFMDAAILMLDAVGADPSRIVELAVRRLGLEYRPDIAAEALLKRVEHIDENGVAIVLPAAIDLAVPDPDPIFRGDDEAWPEERPALLVALFDQRPEELAKALEQLLLSGRRYHVEMAGRAIMSLQRMRPDMAGSLLRTMLSVYVRAPLLVKDLKRDGDRLRHLADAICIAFARFPLDVDAVLEELKSGAPGNQRARIYMIHASAMEVRHDADPVPAGTQPHTVALRRLVNATTIERDRECVRELHSAFRRGPGGMTNVIRADLDILLGAIVMHADILAEFDTPRERQETVLDAMERGGDRMTSRALVEHLVEWAAAGAVGDSASLSRFVELFDILPEEREELRGILLSSAKKMSDSIDGLKALLPHIYRMMVGASVIGRAEAAKAIGDLSWRAAENLPDLLFEAFVALLSDPWVAVHKRAVDALRFGSLPERLERRAADALIDLVLHYRSKSGEDSFVADCIALLAGQVHLFGKKTGALRRFLIQEAVKVDPVFMRRSLSGLGHSLRSEPSFAILAARLLPELADAFNRSDEGPRVLRQISREGLAAHSKELHDAALKVLELDDIFLAVGVIEAFLRAGMMQEALELSRDIMAKLGDSVRMRSRRVLVEMTEIANRYEAAVAAGDAGTISQIADEWQAAADLAESERKDERERSSRSSLPR